MRGNEVGFVLFLYGLLEFLIPMRGNEEAMIEHMRAAMAIPNPHEG